MGECVSKEAEEQQSIKSIQQRPLPQNPNRSYSSKLLNPNITNVVIVEEESYLQQSSLRSIYNVLEENATTRSTLASAVSKVRPLGRTINSMISIQLANISSGRRLHSHAIKCNKMHEVSLCNDFEKNEYDEWYILGNQQNAISDGDVVVIQHKLTKCILRSQNGVLTSSKLQQVSCVNTQQDLHDDDYWVIEIIINDTKSSNTMHVNNLIRIKHFNSGGYLSGTKNKGQLKGHFEICVTITPGQDIWVVEDTN